jgi:hypothetical protein
MPTHNCCTLYNTVIFFSSACEGVTKYAFIIEPFGMVVNRPFCELKQNLKFIPSKMLRDLLAEIFK